MINYACRDTPFTYFISVIILFFIGRVSYFKYFIRYFTECREDAKVLPHCILGLVDMALVNAYIIYRRVHAERTATHAEFMRLMQLSLLSVGAVDFEGDLSVAALTDSPVPPSPTPRYTLPARHTTKQVDVYRVTRGKHGKDTKKRRQYGCKVCSLLRPGKNPWETTFYCVECTEARSSGALDYCTNAQGKLYLCQKVRQHDPNAATNSATCSQIWHDLWRCGASIPPGLKTIRLRAPSRAGPQRSGSVGEANDSDEGSSVASASVGKSNSASSSASDVEETAVV